MRTASSGWVPAAAPASLARPRGHLLPRRAGTALLLALSVLAGCRDPAADLQGGRRVFEERFAGPALASHWRVGVVEGPANKGGGTRSEADRLGHWAVRAGALTTPGERNQGLWLTTALPERVRVQFTARSDSDSGDIKFEAFGDGRRHESGYIFVFGGWNNAMSVLARLDEHEQGRAKREDAVEPGRTYRMALTRRAGTIHWFVDGKLYMKYRDSRPLLGPDHAHFAFNSWQSKLTFDDLEIFDLGED